MSAFLLNTHRSYLFNDSMIRYAHRISNILKEIVLCKQKKYLLFSLFSSLWRYKNEWRKKNIFFHVFTWRSRPIVCVFFSILSLCSERKKNRTFFFTLPFVLDDVGEKKACRFYYTSFRKRTAVSSRGFARNRSDYVEVFFFCFH